MVVHIAMPTRHQGELPRDHQIARPLTRARVTTPPRPPVDGRTPRPRWLPDLDGEPQWCRNPRFVRKWLVEGKDGYQELADLYTIGALAAATGRGAGTIRRWIKNRLIPDSGFKTRPIPNTIDDAARRLWAREQIGAIVRIGKEEGVIGNRRAQKMAATHFAERLRILWLQNDW